MKIDVHFGGCISLLNFVKIRLFVIELLSRGKRSQREANFVFYHLFPKFKVSIVQCNIIFSGAKRKYRTSLFEKTLQMEPRLLKSRKSLKYLPKVSGDKQYQKFNKMFYTMAKTFSYIESNTLLANLHQCVSICDNMILED